MSYIVKNGDTLSKIAQKFGTTYKELARINGISNPNLIKVGQVLKLPYSSFSSSSSTFYTVASGDTLGKIAQKFGTSYQELARINGISDPNFIQVGQVLKIPSSNSYNNSYSFSVPNPSSSSNFYTVVSGDTLSKIAQKFGTSYQEIALINGISNPDLIQVGQVLKIPGSNYSNNTHSSYPSTHNISSSSNFYTVVRGDTLSKIAQKFGTTYQKLASINGITNPDIIKVGQIIKLPNSSSYNTSSPSSFNNSSSNSNKSNSNLIIKVKNLCVYELLKISPWSSKADSLSLAYYTILDNGYSVECAIGLMANLFVEGNYGIVEYSFSKNHRYGFYLPSGGYKCKTIGDIVYVRDWTIDDAGSDKLKKGSCGFGSVQWSYSRRVNFANVCLSIMKKDSDVNDENWAIAESTFITQELKNGYYNSIEKAARNAGGSVEDWAEAFTDKYERPQNACLKMKNSGKACRERRNIAKAIYDYLVNNNAI